ncbi:putative metacaspase protein [Emiliania huxleyi CCMP1516]|uniref:Metacaspase protein n=2 Tax=Emiliania huxleyi TaxID=2903 RepID=A0A0D3I102_EMIH1|nr:putative metacaspase protein [Emiliania huxleyi CCMP1516]EOD04937.1 putative metacaspase protein [Emiliania huxleyi CCMP1516]|eukprot:XP_005757366.1 putative metacaspase protein [Emiliania huxleyi CCMP1516]
MGGCSSSQKTTAEPEQQRTPRRRALLVGMDYRGAPAGWPIINGTRNDVKVFDTLLREHWGFSEEDIVTVTDPAEQSTESLLAALTAFKASLRPGDTAVIFYSGDGHGKQVFDANGDEVTRKGESAPDIMDEALCTTNGTLLDDDLTVLMQGIAASAAQLFWFCDACYSGGFVDQGSGSSLPENVVLIASSLETQKSEDALRIETDKETGKMAMFYQGTGTRWLKAAVDGGGLPPRATHQQLFDALAAERAKDKRTSVQNPFIVASATARQLTL